MTPTDGALPGDEAFAMYKRESEKSLAVLNTILNGLDSIIMATVPETGEILFINDRKKELFGVKDDVVGRICYEALHNRRERCDFCAYHQFSEDRRRITQWNARHPVTGQAHRMTSLLVDWPGRGKAHLEWGVDITEAVYQQEMLESVLDSMDSYIYVTDLDTDEILFINRKMAADFGLKHNIRGDICWKHLQPGMEKRCDFCPKSRLIANPGEVIRSKAHNPIVNKTFSVIDRVIDWPGGKRVHVEQAIDVTDAEHSRDALVQREKILDILNHAAMIFLRRGHLEFGKAMERGIGLVADIANVDRMSVFRNSVRPDGLHLSQLYRWRKEAGGTVTVRPKLKDTTYAAFVPRWEGILAAGECVSGIARFMPEADALKPFGCVTLLAVPVFTDGTFWGMVLFEKLVEENFTAYEINVLRSASFMLATAVMRNEEAIALRETTERVKLMLDASPFGCILWGQNRKAIDCNEAILRLLGIADKATLTERIFEFAPECQPDGRRSDEKALAMVDRAFGGEICVFEWVHQAMDGTPIPSEVTLTLVKQKNFSVVVGYTRDLRERRKMSLELKRRSNLLRAVNHVSAIMLQTNSGGFEADLLRSMGILAEASGADRVYVWKNHVRDGQIYCSQIYEWSENVEPQQGKEFSVESSYNDLPRWKTALLERRCINNVVRDMPAEEQLLLRPQGILSILVVPIFIKNAFWGFIGFDDCRRERMFSENEENIIRSASDMIANALVRNEEAAAIRRVNEYAKLMLDATPLGCVLWSPDHKAIDCNEAILKILGINDKAALLEHRFDYAPECQPDGRRSREKLFEMLDKALAEGLCVFDWTHRTRDGAPVPAEITMVRVRYGDSYVVPGYTRDLRAVRQLEENILHLESEVEKIYYDPLTGIYNRRFFDKNTARLIATLSRSGSLLSLLMIDVDHFKQYNDIYGHAKGDECLKRIAETLRNTVTRTDDFVARYGGEEFVAVLPNTDENGARIVARKLLENVLRRDMPHEKSGDAQRVTISIGVASGKVKHTHDANDFIRRADAMLYEAKRNGRNRYAFVSF